MRSADTLWHIQRVEQQQVQRIFTPFTPKSMAFSSSAPLIMDTAKLVSSATFRKWSPSLSLTKLYRPIPASYRHCNRIPKSFGISLTKSPPYASLSGLPLMEQERTDLKNTKYHVVDEASTTSILNDTKRSCITADHQELCRV